MCQHRAGWGPCQQWAGFPASPPLFGWETPPSHHAHMSAGPSLPASHRTAAWTGAHFFLWPESLPAHATNVNGANVQHGHSCLFHFCFRLYKILQKTVYWFSLYTIFLLVIFAMFKQGKLLREHCCGVTTTGNPMVFLVVWQAYDILRRNYEVQEAQRMQQ